MATGMRLQTAMNSGTPGVDGKRTRTGAGAASNAQAAVRLMDGEIVHQVGVPAAVGETARQHGAADEAAGSLGLRAHGVRGVVEEEVDGAEVDGVGADRQLPSRVRGFLNFPNTGNGIWRMSWHAIDTGCALRCRCFYVCC